MKAKDLRELLYSTDDEAEVFVLNEEAPISGAKDITNTVIASEPCTKYIEGEPLNGLKQKVLLTFSTRKEGN